MIAEASSSEGSTCIVILRTLSQTVPHSWPRFLAVMIVRRNKVYPSFYRSNLVGLERRLTNPHCQHPMRLEIAVNREQGRVIKSTG